MTREDVLERISDLFIHRGPPEYLRSDNGPEFTDQRVRAWQETVGVKTLFIEPGSPWENGFSELFNAELLANLRCRIPWSKGNLRFSKLVNDLLGSIVFLGMILLSLS